MLIKWWSCVDDWGSCVCEEYGHVLIGVLMCR